MKFTLHTGPQQGKGDIHKYPITTEIDTVDKLIQATRSDHTPADFGGEHRDFKNFKGADCILGDIDNADRIPDYWVTLEDIKKIFAGYAYAVTPSRNNEIEKGGEEARPKWHMYFPIKHTDNPNKYEKLMQQLHDKFSDVGFDPAVKDAARLFFGHADNPGPSYINEGKNISTAFAGRPRKKGNEKKAIPWRDLSIDELLAYPEVIPEGERYAAQTVLTMALANKGKSADEIVDIILKHNAKMKAPRDVSDGKIMRGIKNLASSAVKKVGETGGPDPDANFSMIRNFRVVKDNGKHTIIPIRSTSTDMRAAMKKFVVLAYQSGNGALTLRDNPAVVITKPATLSAVLESIGYVWDIRAIPGALNKDDILERFIQYSQKVSRMSCVPEEGMDKDTLFVPQIEFPDAQENGAFREFLEIFSFKSITDQYRFAAGLLSLYLPGAFDGKIPMFALLAEAQNAGKTTVVRTGINLLSGMDALEQKGGKDNMQDDHAQFGGVLGLCAKGVLYDNLMNLSRTSETEISRAITDINRSAWDMGKSRGHIRNSYVYFSTFNDTEGFGRDLQERIIAVRMSDPDSISNERRLGIESRIAEWTQNRADIIADIRYLMEKTMPRAGVTVKSKPKYVSWTERISGPLSAAYPEVEEFDFSAGSDDHKIDPGRGMLEESVLEILHGNISEAGREISTGKWCIDFTPKKLYGAFLAVSPDYARALNALKFSRLIMENRKEIPGVLIERLKGKSAAVRDRNMYRMFMTDELYKYFKDNKNEAAVYDFPVRG